MNYSCYKNGYLPSIILFIAFFTSISYSRTMDDYAGMVFPSNHALNMPVDSLPVHPNSQKIINSMGANTSLHPDFGTQWDDNGTMRQMGIPYNVVGAGQPLVPITFVLYDKESDPGPWPIPTDPFIETVFDWREPGEGDRHLLIIDTSRQKLYEAANFKGNASGTGWEGSCGSVFDLTSTDLRPAGWTSSDAAGLPVFPLLVRYDEVDRAMAKGEAVSHAIRVTASRTQRAYIWPARHYASSSTDADRPPMGLRFRLKADFDISSFTPRMQVILRTFKKYGLIMSDNGSNWYFQGTHDERWDDDELRSLKKLRGGDFEAVDISPWMNRPGFDPNSAAVPVVSQVRRVAQRPADRKKMTLRPGNLDGKNTYTVNYSLVKGGNADIRISDLHGRKVLAPVNGFKEAGEYSASFPANFFPGVYLIVFRIENTYIETESFIVSRYK